MICVYPINGYITPLQFVKVITKLLHQKWTLPCWVLILWRVIEKNVFGEMARHMCACFKSIWFNKGRFCFWNHVLFFFHSKVYVSITHYSELYWQVLPWKIQQQPCLLTWSFFCEASQYHECCCVLSNCIAGDIMIEHRLPKLIEACQSQHKLCSKCCSAACVKVTAPEPAITVNVGVVYDLIKSTLHLWKKQQQKQQTDPFVYLVQ